MNKRIWRTHTGSAPGCQDTPKAIISNWFYGERIRVGDARACLDNLIYLQEQEGDYEHRCFNRREYALDIDDVKAIIRELKNA